MKHGSLFSGIGGFDLAAELSGFKNTFQVETDYYCQLILRKNFPGVKRYFDIRRFNKYHAEKYGGTVDIISGGFPCQPFSIAGKRRGSNDDRYLWPEMLKSIKIIRPAWVVGENVAGIISMALDQVLSDLESLGYSVQAFIIPACAVDAPHRRDRIWIVANSISDGRKRNGSTRREYTSCRRSFYETKGSNYNSESMADPNSESSSERSEQSMGGQPLLPARFSEHGEAVSYPHGQRSETRGAEPEQPRQAAHADIGNQDAADTNGKRLPISEHETILGAWGREERGATIEPDWWTTEPDVGRVVNGIPFRVDRLKSLGNAIVPKVAYQIFKAISKI